jgi:hypothetical protein
MEITAGEFRHLGSTHPQAVEQIGMAAITRRAELDAAKKAAPGAAVGEAPANFIARMRRFLRF